MVKWKQWAAVLPVAVGHGILSLLLLEELCDGKQLFQDVLNKRNEKKTTQLLLKQDVSSEGRYGVSAGVQPAVHPFRC